MNSQDIENRAMDILFGGDADQQQSEEHEEQNEGNEESALASDGEQTNDQANTQSEVLEEVEVNGKNYKVPTEIKKSLMQEASFTKNSQALADEKRVFAAQREQLKAQAEFQSSSMPDISALQALDSQITAFKSLDWGSLSSEDMMRYRGALDQLKDKREDLIKVVDQKYKAFDQKRRESKAEMAKASDSYLAKQIPKWSAETAKDLADYAKQRGYTEPELEVFDNPKLIEELWKARQWDKLQASKTTAQNKANKAPPVVKPGAFDPGVESQTGQKSFKQKFAKAKSNREKEDLIIERFSRDL